jgi:hypothetical protein
VGQEAVTTKVKTAVALLVAALAAETIYLLYPAGVRSGTVEGVTRKINGVGTREGEYALLMRDSKGRMFYCVARDEIAFSYAGVEDPVVRRRSLNMSGAVTGNHRTYSCPSENIRPVQ